MRSHVKASSTASTQRQARGLGRFVRGAVAFRGGSGDGDGSGAPSLRRLGFWIGVAALALLALAPTSSAKIVVNGFGSSAQEFNEEQLFGGRFNGSPFASSEFGVSNPVAVNESGVGAPQGTVYVLDSDGTRGRRVQRFSPAGVWQRAWGENVIAPAVTDQQLLKIENAAGGTYRLTFNGATTGPIVYDDSNTDTSALLQALRALPTVGNANVSVAFSFINSRTMTFTVIFKGALAGIDQPMLTADTSGLLHDSDASAPVSIEISSLADGGPSTTDTGTGFEICTIAVECQGGRAEGTTANGGQLSTPQGIALNQANGHVYVTDSANRRVSEFDADGNFVRAWGWDVVSTGGAGDVSSDAFEICTVAADCKQAAPAGADGGRFGGALGLPVTDSANNVWVADASNRRIQEFDSSGNFIAAYGHDVDALGGGGGLEKCTSTASGACKAGTEGSGAGQFSSNNPTELAFDADGNVYARDSGNNRIEKFDPTLLASATHFGSAALSPYTAQKAGVHMVAIDGGERLAIAVVVVIDEEKNITERVILEVDPDDESVDDTSFVGAGLDTITGLGVDDVSDLLYTSTSDPNSPARVLALRSTPPPAPLLSIGGATETTDTSSRLAVSVDPQGGWVGDCKFQYSTDQLVWQDVAAPDCKGLAINGGPQSVTAVATGLIPAQHYYFRFQASRPFVSGSTVTSGEGEFDTVAVPPVVSKVGTVEISDKFARLVGTIDPRNADTEYVFEYGPTPALGQTTPATNIGGGTTPVTVSQVVSGLSPDTTYYFRLSATNPTGTTNSSPNETLHTRLNPLPPSQERGWEMVTPVDKNYTDADRVSGPYPPQVAGVSPDGNSVAFCSTALYGEPSGRMTSLCAPYMSRRGTDGWQTTNPFPSYCRIDPLTGVSGGTLTAFLAPDFSRYAIKKAESSGCPFPPLDPNAPLAKSGESVAENLYYWDPSTDSPTSHLLNTAFSPEGDPSEPLALERVAGGSDDLSRIVFLSGSNQTPEPDSPPQGFFQKVYSWQLQGEGSCTDPEGCLNLLSKDPANQPFTTASAIPTECCSGGGSTLNQSAVSSDGKRVFFVNPLNETGLSIGIEGTCRTIECEIYMREDASTTVDVSASECTVSCGTAQDHADFFLLATPSGNNAFFTSCAKLTNSSSPVGCGVSPWSNQQVGYSGNQAGENGSKLYRWERDADPGQHLVDLTEDNESADGTQPDFRSLIGTSDDGDTVFFTTGNQIVSGEDTSAAVNTFDNQRLYRWQWNDGSPTVDYLGPYERVENTNGSDVNLPTNRDQVTPDGEHLLVFTKLAIDQVADSDEDADIYRWSEDEGWRCISCQGPGVASKGSVSIEEVNLKYFETLFPSLGPSRPRIFMSDDGERVFFGTPDALVPQDVNGDVACPLDPIDSVVAQGSDSSNLYTCTDVYEWHDGTVSLISSGTGSEATRLISASRSGDDVFFYTRQALVGWDKDLNTDIYDARIGGGFPEPPAEPPTCEGEACRGQGTTPPATQGAGTAVFQGPGDPAPKHKAQKKKKKKKKSKKRRNKQAAKKKRAAAKHKRAADHNRGAQR